MRVWSKVLRCGAACCCASIVIGFDRENDSKRFDQFGRDGLIGCCASCSVPKVRMVVVRRFFSYIYIDVLKKK